MNLHVRLITDDDLDNHEFWKFYSECISEFDKTKYNYYRNEIYLSSSQFCRMYVLFNEDRPVGIATLLMDRKNIHNGCVVGQIEDVVIHKDFRGKDLGQFLIRTLISIAFERGAYKVVLNCNEKLKPFYEKCGMKQSGIQMRIDKND